MYRTAGYALYRSAYALPGYLGMYRCKCTACTAAYEIFCFFLCTETLPMHYSAANALYRCLSTIVLPMNALYRCLCTVLLTLHCTAV